MRLPRGSCTARLPAVDGSDGRVSVRSTAGMSAPRRTAQRSVERVDRRVHSAAGRRWGRSWRRGLLTFPLLMLAHLNVALPRSGAGAVERYSTRTSDVCDTVHHTHAVTTALWVSRSRNGWISNAAPSLDESSGELLFRNGAEHLVRERRFGISDHARPAPIERPITRVTASPMCRSRAPHNTDRAGGAFWSLIRSASVMAIGDRDVQFLRCCGERVSVGDVLSSFQWNSASGIRVQLHIGVSCEC